MCVMHELTCFDFISEFVEFRYSTTSVMAGVSA